jgi:hypothetical protein
MAIIFAVIVRRNVSKWEKLPAIPVFAKIIALISLALWIETILAGVNVPALTGVG